MANNLDLGTQMENWLDDVRKLVPNLEQKKKMTNAGANVLANNLQNVTRKEHYQSNRKVGKVKHLADSIVAENKDMDNVDNGNSVVGFEKANISGINHARIARFLNDGTKKMVGDNFYTDTVRDSTKEVLAAERVIYEHGGGD